jgi:hypothetical protein
MNSVWKVLVALGVSSVPLLAGALVLQVGDPASNPEAMKNHSVLVARITACQSPEKTTVSATAEGMVNGVRRSVPLKVVSLSAPGTFGVTREWPAEGTWVIKMVATNPVYKDYATSVVILVRNQAVQLSTAKHYFHAATDAEVGLALN